MRETFQVNLPARSLFEAATVAAIAELIVAREARPGQTVKIARALQHLKHMSAEDRPRILQQKKGSEDI